MNRDTTRTFGEKGLEERKTDIVYYFDDARFLSILYTSYSSQN
jgi:hypothetical protein